MTNSNTSFDISNSQKSKTLNPTISSNPENKGLSQKFVKSLARILKTDEKTIINNKFLFAQIDLEFLQCINYMSKIEKKDLKMSAALSLNYILQYNESAFDD